MRNITIGYLTIIKTDKYVINVCEYVFIIYGLFCRFLDEADGGCEWEYVVAEILW